MPRFAIRYPYLIVVICLITSVIGIATMSRMPVDLFPPIKIPVVVVATFYSGMAPEQIESNITTRCERFFTLASGIDHVESRSLQGVSLIKIFFQPGQNADAAVSNISNLAAAEMRRLPPGTLPPIVLKFDASSLPVCLITLKGEGLGETELRDVGHYVIRNQVAGVPGASVPTPFGGKYRQIMVYVDPLKLEAHQISVMDVVRSVNESNLVLPSGDVRIGTIDYNLYANSQIETMKEIEHIPLKTVGQSSVLVGDVGEVKDGAQIQTNMVRVDGQRSAYLPVLKQGGDSNTIAVVNGVREKIAHLVDVPKKLVTGLLFDQSTFVKNAIENLVHEGTIGLVLTGLLILLFLGSLRGTLCVFLSIPLSALATFIALSFGDGTINTMVLGGLALAFSRLIDNSVVVLENIFRHLEMGEPPAVAAEKGGQEVALPVLAATLTTVVVFLPVTFLYGVSRYLFTALAAAVVLSLIASYFVAMTVVPLFCANFIKTVHGHDDHGGEGAKPKGLGARFNAWFNRRFNSMLDRYGALLSKSLMRPVATVIGIGGAFLLSFGAVPFIGVSYFPRTDPGQFVVNVKVATGTRLEATEPLVAQVEEIVRQEVGEKELDLIVSNIGTTPDFTAIYNSNTGQHNAFVQVGLKEGHKVGSYEYMERVRKRLRKDLPQVIAYFQSGGLVDAVINMGLPAPLDIQISSKNIRAANALATDLARQIHDFKGVSDVLVPQEVDYPALRLNIDRERAAQLSLTQKEVMGNVITALTSNGMIAPSFWSDPKSNNDYMLTVQYPESQIKDLADLKAIPLRGTNQARSARLDTVGEIVHELSPTEVDHYQLRPVQDIYVTTAGEDLGKVSAQVNKLIAGLKLPEGMLVTVRGSVQGMNTAFTSFGFGLILSVVLVYLILVAQFKSFIDPLIILLAVPGGVMGVMLTLWLTGTTLNIMSLMGVVMMVGVVTSDSILIVEFVRQLRADGMGVREALATGCRVRMRPILMTTLATLIGLMPMAMALGAGSEAYAPLARAIIGGLAVSALLTMFVVPAAYLLVYGRKERPEPPLEAEAVEA